MTEKTLENKDLIMSALEMAHFMAQQGDIPRHQNMTYPLPTDRRDEEFIEMYKDLIEEIEDVGLDGLDLATPATVDIIASGYEWTCHRCGILNKEIEYLQEVICKQCGRKYDTDAPEHAYG